MMNLLKKSTISGFLLAASFAVVTPAASAIIAVKVPFAFNANGKEMPAGAYTISENDPSGIVYVRGAQGAVMLTSTPGNSPANAKPGLIFERVNGKQYLIGVQTGYSDSRSMAFHAPAAALTALR